MARRTLNRKELRAASDAAERRAEGEEEEQEEEQEEETDEEAEASGDEDDDEAPKTKPKKKVVAKVAKAPKTTKPRKSKAAKSTRMKVMWGVFNNSNQKVASFDYPRRPEADALAAKLTEDKKNTHFVQPVKEPMPVEEKKKE